MTFRGITRLFAATNYMTHVLLQKFKYAKADEAASCSVIYYD